MAVIKMKKRMNIVFLLLILTLMMFSPVSIKGEQLSFHYRVYVDIPDLDKNNSLEPGSDITYIIKGGSYDGKVTEMDLEYDQSKLELVSIEPNALFKTKEVGDISKSPVHIKLGDPESPVGVELYNVTFRIKKDVSYGPATFTIKNIKGGDNNVVDDVHWEIMYSIRNNNNNIESIGFSQGILDRKFTQEETDYQLKVPKGTETINVEYELVDTGNARASGDIGTVSLAGKDKLEIVVTAENGETKTYTFHLTEGEAFELDDNNYLQMLLPSEGYLPFDSNVFEYHVEVPYTITDFEIEAVPQNSRALIETRGAGSLVPGDNVVSVIVTAENGETRTYTVTVTRKEKSETDDQLAKDMSLKSLVVKDHHFHFDPSVSEYTLALTTFEPLDIQAEVNDSNSKVAIQGNQNLKDGSVVRIIVTAENGVNQTYTLKISDANVHGNEGSSEVDHTALWITLAVVLTLCVGVVIVMVVMKKKKKNNKKTTNPPKDNSKNLK